MFKKFIDYLGGLSWFVVIAVILVLVSFGYVFVFGLVSLALYYLLLAIFSLMLSYREAPKVVKTDSK